MKNEPAPPGNWLLNYTPPTEPNQKHTPRQEGAATTNRAKPKAAQPKQRTEPAFNYWQTTGDEIAGIEQDIISLYKRMAELKRRFQFAAEKALK